MRPRYPSGPANDVTSLECRVGVSSWSVELECRVGVSSWSVELECRVGVSRNRNCRRNGTQLSSVSYFALARATRAGDRADDTGRVGSGQVWQLITPIP